MVLEIQNDDCKQDDIYDIVVDIAKEDKLFKYAEIDSYCAKQR